jgi:predicted Zn-ribbon and HTH transcriptional regulator
MDNNKAKLIKTWDELKEEKSDTHILEIEDCCGWIRPKVENEKTYWENNHYLSTHTFYGLTYTYSTRILQECGFNVQLKNWDGETEWYDRDEYLEYKKLANAEKVKQVINNEKFKEQRLYDLLNRLVNARYEKPIFHKCKSCGFGVVEYQLDNNGICNDCREEG